MAGTVTLSDVARAAGVSLATASRAINGSANRTVRPHLREKVLAAAAQLNYSPDANAQAMARGHTTTLGLIVHDIADPYFASIAAGVTAAAEQHGLIVTLAITSHESAREQQFIEMLQSQRARAIVIAGGRYDDPAALDGLARSLESFAGTGGSVALIGQPVLGVNTVEIGNRDGARDLAIALHGLGYRKFAIIAGPDTHMTARDRREGFADALVGLGCPIAPAAIVRSEFTRDGGYEGMTALLADDADVDLVFAVNDVMAVGAIAAAREAGKMIGDDVAVAGFDDIVTLRDVNPGLTTVRLPLVQLGEQATSLALTATGDEPLVVRVDGEVVLRESTPPR